MFWIGLGIGFVIGAAAGVLGISYIISDPPRHDDMWEDCERDYKKEER